MEEIQKRIVVKINVEGIHKWEDCNLIEVGFLKNLHRHIFYITLQKSVDHNNRDIEIIMLKREIESYLNNKFFNQKIMTHNFNNMSCEDIAEDLLIKFKANYVEVLEDNENGAVILK